MAATIQTSKPARQVEVAGGRPGGSGRQFGRLPVAALLNITTAVKARERRGIAHELLLRISDLAMRYEYALIPDETPEMDLSTAFLSRWLELIPDLLILRDLLNRLAATEAA
jgi:hypothetical protein